MNRSDPTAPMLAQALTKLLGPARPGAMAFIRCLPGEIARTLAADARFQVLNWRIAVVGQTADEATRAITADQAVEWREAKAEAVLLLVDTDQAGAGMDGIYSAARELSEAVLFRAAKAQVRTQLTQEGRRFTDKALVQARRLARNHALSPWREFAYLCRVSVNPADLGAALPEIGLWPLAVSDTLDDSDLEKSARLVERLLARQGKRPAAEMRVTGLQLPEAEASLGDQLAEFLREADGLSQLDALAQLATHETLWLNKLHPGLFSTQTLRSIRWVNWRGKSGKPAAWSGLSADTDQRLLFKLATQDSPQQRVRLEVRWDALPATLAKGGVDYTVEVRSGGTILAEKISSHTAKNPQKCIFTQDDFEVEENNRYNAEVVIRALTAEAQAKDDDAANPLHAVSEDFIVCFGATEQPPKQSTGNVYPTLALAAIQVAETEADFKYLAEKPDDKQAFSADKKGYITCRLGGKTARVLCPNLLLDLGVTGSDARQF